MFCFCSCALYFFLFILSEVRNWAATDSAANESSIGKEICLILLILFLDYL